MMRATFFGLEIARTGLNVSQKGLDVTGHNVANVDTPGYTRQRLITTSYEPYSAITQFRPITTGLVGSGTHVVILDQIRSVFLDRQYRTEQTLQAYWSTRTQGLTYIESQFEGPDVTSLNGGIDALFKAFMSLSNDSSDLAPRSAVKHAAEALTLNLNTLYNTLVAQQQDKNTAVKVLVDDVNRIALNIAALNESIYSFELTGGQPANDLRDKRNLLLDQLSGIADIHYEEVDGKLRVYLGGKDGMQLINHKAVNELYTTPDTVDPITGITIDTPRYNETVGGVTTMKELVLNSGELKSNIELRDNDGSDPDNMPQGIPYFINQLNNLAKALVQIVNEVHNKGYTYPVSGASQTGVDFFDVPGGSIANVNAGNISLSQAVLDSEYNIAASDIEIILNHSDPDKIQSGNQLIAKEIYELINRSDLMLNMGGPPNDVDIGSFESYINGILTALSSTLNYSKKMTEQRETLLLNVDTQRTSVAGVSLDEEMTNLIKYQHAYSGASRVITTMDEALDILINRMGRVGL